MRRLFLSHLWENIGLGKSVQKAGQNEQDVHFLAVF